MTNRAEFERLLDVYGFRCERFGQDLSTHARAQVVSAFAALASAPVAGESRKHIEQMAVNRYRPVPDGKFSYKVVAGDGTRSLYTGTKDSCLRVAAKLTEAFLDGAFVASDAAPQASAEQMREALQKSFEMGKFYGSLPETDAKVAPQASEAVRDEDVVTLLNFIFERFSAPCKAGDLPGYVVPAIRRLERAALSAEPAQKEQSDA